jgi:DNA recombination protein RmuC
MEIQNVVLIASIGILLGTMGTWIVKKRAETIMREQIHNRDIEITELTMLETEMETRLRDQQKSFDEKMALLNESKDIMKLEFESLASKIMEEKTKSFTIQNKENMSIILDPLKEQIGEFKKRVEDVYDKESQGRAALVNEIANLKSLNLKISDDAVALTQALKGDNKIQGDWGQLVLERVFELSGLERGREYEIQVHTHNLAGDHFYPDAIVKLPKRRDVIVDSKMSLVAYEQYCSAPNDEERALALKNHLLSVRRHVKELSEKNYDQLEEVTSLDFVLLFIPVEPAFILAIKEDSCLYADAIKKNIILVSPTTCLLALKTIAHTWKVEKQQKNSEEIAQRAGDLFDKFCMFLNSFQEIGDALKRAQDRYDQSLKYLANGKGNLIKRAEELKAIGVSGKKQIPSNLLEQCGLDSPESNVSSPDKSKDDQKGDVK